MAIDLSKLSDEDFDALEKGDLTSLSDEALDMLEGRERPAAAPTPAPAAPSAPVEPLRKGPQGPRRYPGQNKDQRRLPLLPRDVRTPTDVSPARGVSGLLGIPGGAVRMVRSVAELGGETETSRALKELEASIAARAPEKEVYEFGRVVPEILPFGVTAGVISKLPVASRLGMSALQTAGQAGTAYAITPENREEAALITGLLGAAGEAAQPVYQLGKRGVTKIRQLLSTTGPVGATPAEEAAVRIAREKAPGMEATEAELAAARESERLKREEAERLKAKYLQNEADRAARKGELVKAKTTAEEAKARVEAETSAAVKDAKAKQDAIADQIRDRGKQLTEEAKATDKVLEETNIREAAEDAKGTLEDRASGFKTLSQNLKQEADAAKATAVEPLPVRDKKSRAVDFRQLILSKRENLKEARDKSIGRVVDPKTGKTEPLPFLKAALDKEDAGQTISAAPAFRNLVNFVRDRAENISRYGDDVLLPHAKFLKELEPIRETIDASGQKVKEVVPIKFEKLWELRRRIEKARTGETATGYEVLEKEKREDLLKEIDNALDEFGVGYKDFNKKYSEASRPLDDFEFGIGEKATETRKFSRNTFIETPEVVLDTALSKPSRSSAERLKPLFEDADQDKLENIIFESLVEKAGNTAKGYDDVLKKYGEFLEVFPNAKNAFRAEADRVKTAFGEAEKTSAFKERWAKRMEDRADKAEKAVKSISGMQERVKTSMTSPLKEGALDDIGAFVRANPSMRPKVGAALQDVLNSMDDRVLIRALEVPERQAAFMRAGMDRSQIDDVLAGARRRSDERAAKLAEVKEMGRSFREAKKETEAAKSAAAESKRAATEEVKKAGAEIGKLSAEGRAEEIAKKQAQAEFQAARGLRVSAQQKRQALSELTPDMRDAINIEAEKIPLNTTEGLARATTLATVLGGVGSVVAGSVLGGMLTAGVAAAGATGRRILIKKQQKQIADEIKNVVSEILKDETGGVVSAIEGKINRANDVAAAQRIANKALSRLGYKPGVGAVTSSVIYNAYAQEPSPEAEKTESVAEEAPASEPVAEETPAKEPVAEEPAPVAEAKPYTFESLTPDQVKRMGEYFDSLGMNKDFLLNARTFNATPFEKRKRLFDLMETRNMARGGPVYTPAEEVLLRRYSSR